MAMLGRKSEEEKAAKAARKSRIVPRRRSASGYRRSSGREGTSSPARPGRPGSRSPPASRCSSTRTT